MIHALICRALDSCFDSWSVLAARWFTGAKLTLQDYDDYPLILPSETVQRLEF